ncbi:blastula protease 10-like [Hydractinia symbiolongicarpus]|uniref:blastula protease 10-like n=1 Tax=Hydractinia symbiolongicarpus TaxID=13093 RepID=UPI00254D92EF|nr:blastula protease 10-like [Hydractinia symbiolongicarpus]
MYTLSCFLVAAMATFVVTHNPEEGNLFEGDIILSPDQRAALEEQQSKNSFASIKSYHWKDGTGKPDLIVYFIDPAIAGARSVILQAVADYEKETCLRFQEVGSKPLDQPHLYFASGSGCSSPVGKYGNGNRISLAPGCWTKGIVMHEMGHSLGFFHEQSRPDRDQYVKILYENIDPNAAFNFNKYNTDRIDSLDTAYDYKSMMHYGGKYFTTDWNKLTIQTLDPAMQDEIGQRNGFSNGDILQFNKMYCSGSTGGVCQDTDTNCKHWTTYCSSNRYVQQNCMETCGKC